MKPDSPLKLVSQLLDLPILDSDGKYCGIVDDVELSGGPGKPLKVKALMVGPGAYDVRLPRWAMWLVRKTAGDRVVRIAIEKIRTIGATVELNATAAQLGLASGDREAGKLIPHKGAL